MSDRTMRMESRARRGAVALMLCVSLGALSACDGLLEVDLPSQLTDDALQDPKGAATQVASVIALFECGYSAFTWVALGHEDVFESIAGVAGTAHRFRATPVSGGCDESSEDQSWYDQISGARSLAYGVYDRIQNVWTAAQVPDRERLSAIAALYAAASLDHFGEYYCEMTVDNGPLMTPDATLALGEQWIEQAFGHITSAGGDFAMPYGISSSAETMAYGLRARMRGARGDDAGALADAQQVPKGFMAWVTRDVGPIRRNKIYVAGTAVGFSGMLGPNTWWDGPPNPATGQNWPSPVPFTGYLDLGILGDGRAVNDQGLAITTADAGAVPDTRVPHFLKSIQGPAPRHVPDKYKAEDEDIPLVNWKEMWLIRAEIEGGQTAIDLVNELRADAGLPLVTYADPGNAQQIRYLITEEKRRALWLEGRYWSHKIQNTDLLWFPRAVGNTPAQGYNYEGGVRLVMPESEYSLNPNLTLGDRGKGCDPNQAPVSFGI